MKYSFSFIQIANWVYVIRQKLKDFRIRLDKEKVTKEEAIKLLETQKKHLSSVKLFLNKQNNLIGIQRDFLRNFKQIKKEYGIEE